MAGRIAFVHQKTAHMHKRLTELKWDVGATANPSKKYLLVNDKQHLILHGLHKDFATNETIISISTRVNDPRREILLLDPKSPLLQKLYEKAKNKRLIGPVGINRFIAQTIAVVRETFESDKTDPISAAWAGEKYENQPVIPLDEFVAKKTGCCRHHALLTCYLLDRFIKEGLLEGDVFFARGVVEGGLGHAWVIFRPANLKLVDAYLIDTMWTETVYLLEGNEDKLASYGKMLEQCKIRYLSPSSADFFKQLNPKGTTFHVDSDMRTCFYKDETQKSGKMIYTFAAKLGEGSSAVAYEFRPLQHGKSLVIKAPLMPTEFNIKDSDEAIMHFVGKTNVLIAREVPFLRKLSADNVGAVFYMEHPLVININNGRKVLKSYPKVFLAMEFVGGTKLTKYEIKSSKQYVEVATAIIQETQRVHANNIVHLDIHPGNINIIEEKHGIRAKLYDHGLSQTPGGRLCTDNLVPTIKPTDWKGKRFINASFEDDIYCVGLTLAACFNGKIFGSRESSVITKIIAMLTNHESTERLTLDEALKCFNNLTCDPYLLIVSDRMKELSPASQTNYFVQKYLELDSFNDRKEFMNLLGIEFFRKMNMHELMPLLRKVPPDQIRELFADIFHLEKKELEKSFPSPAAINKWLHCMAMIDNFINLNFSSLPRIYFREVRNSALCWIASPTDAMFAEGKIGILLESIVDPEKRIILLQHLMKEDVKFFPVILQVYKYIDLSAVTPRAVKLFRAHVAETKESLELQPESKDTQYESERLDQLLYCSAMLHAMPREDKAVNLTAEIEAFYSWQLGEGARHVKLSVGLLISVLKNPFIKDKINLLYVVGIEDVKKMLPCASPFFLEAFTAIPDDQKGQFIAAMGFSNLQLQAVVEDEKGTSCEPSKISIRQKIAEYLSESERNLSLRNLLVNLRSRLSLKTHSEENGLLALDKWCYVESIFASDLSSGKIEEAIRHLSEDWKLGVGAQELSRLMVASDASRLIEILLKSAKKNRLFLLTNIPPQSLRKIIKSPQDLMRIFPLIQESDRTALLKMFDMNFLKLFQTIPPQLIPHVREAFGPESMAELRIRAYTGLFSYRDAVVLSAPSHPPLSQGSVAQRPGLRGRPASATS